jgi:hypothetical protein
VEGLDATAKAICDDYTAIAHWKITLEVYDRLHASIGLGPKTAILWPHKHPPPTELVTACADRGIQLKLGSAKALGTHLGFDPVAVGAVALKRAHKKDYLFKAIRHPFMRKQTAARILASCLQPCMGFDLRVCVPEYIVEATEHFDSKLIAAADYLLSLTPKKLTDPISPDLVAVLYLVIKPSRWGGMTLRLSITGVVEAPARHHWCG